MELMVKYLDKMVWNTLVNNNEVNNMEIGDMKIKDVSLDTLKTFVKQKEEADSKDWRDFLVEKSDSFIKDDGFSSTSRKGVSATYFNNGVFTQQLIKFMSKANMFFWLDSDHRFKVHLNHPADKLSYSEAKDIWNRVN